MKLIRPAIGNHDYQSQRGAAYYRYFGVRAGPVYKGYYSYDIGEWHAIALNSEIAARGSLYERSEQEDWLRRDLRERGRLCTLAYFHRPLYSSGAHGSSPIMQSIWKILADGGVDLVINGHEHHYERFLPMNAAGVLDTLRGMEQIIVGTGGGDLTGIRSSKAPNSAVQIQGRWGALIATLGTDEYRTSFHSNSRPARRLSLTRSLARSGGGWESVAAYRALARRALPVKMQRGVVTDSRVITSYLHTISPRAHRRSKKATETCRRTRSGGIAHTSPPRCCRLSRISPRPSTSFISR
jgi:hypothetical protein